MTRIVLITVFEVEKIVFQLYQNTFSKYLLFLKAQILHNKIYSEKQLKDIKILLLLLHLRNNFKQKYVCIW